jgi:molybdopterin molybdotransferase
VITPESALQRILALKNPLPKEQVSIFDATGRWAAEPVIALRTQPARDLSAMDGYAVAHGSGPWRVIGESAAGAPFSGKVGPDEAVRIFTGAALPTGADTIIIQEDAQRDGDTIAGKSKAAEHVRTAGSDFEQGATLIEPGNRLTPARIGLAALAGHAQIAVRRPVRIALVSTGNELVSVGSEHGTDRIPSSNAPMLAALLANLPTEIVDLGIITDDLASLSETYRKHDAFDVMVSTGGASVGDHDLVRPALIQVGATIDFWKIAMRPGKPLMAGKLGDTVILGLPGNPVSAFVTATLFLAPLIEHLSGANDPAPHRMTARLASDMPAVGQRTDYVRAYWQDGRIVPLPGDSGMLAPLAMAEALIIRAADAGPVHAGKYVDIIPIT